MVKILGCILFIISSSMAGFYFSERLKSRLNFLKEFISFLKSLQIQLRYCNGDILQILPLCSDSKTLEPFIKNLSDKNKEYSSFAEIWKDSVIYISKSNCLTKSDINSMLEFGNILGTTDVAGQLNHIDLYIEIFNKAYENAREELKSKSKLYKTMGFFIGTTIALMIV
ncbi:MAG: stage III sporulation protein AB [Ruminococcus sp.]|nr:stage III sporulation protein AB [Ruminococcus sp.]